jgi:hypothetical protein
MAPKPEWALAGTMPGDHGLSTIKAAVEADPRQRWFAIVEVTARHTKTYRPEDGDDETTQVITVVALEPVTATADVDQLRTMRDKARANRPGQGTMDEASQGADPASAAS